MKKLLALLLSIVLVLGVFTACTAANDPGTEKAPTNDTVETPEEPKVAELTKVVALKGPTGMGMAKLITDADPKYSFELTSMPDDVTSSLISGTVDIAAVPTNLASVLYNKTQGGVKVIALNTLGVLHIINSDGTVASIEDLKGKTIGATGQASTPEYVLDYVLKANGIDPENDVTINYYTDHAELATHMISGDVTIGMLPEPQVSTVLMKNGDCKKVINLTEEWSKVSPDSALVQGCIVVRTAFAEEYPDTVKNFLEEYKASVEFANTDETAPDVIANLGIVGSSAIAKSAIPGANICYVDSNDAMKEKLSGFLKVLLDANPKSVGGALPGDDFYYENK
ncbi:MAG: ABC transporter substrate-binding protein [Clostridia bacterium]|nr:ABC transporter substrate-binding protein [Clostridia bacterium]